MWNIHFVSHFPPQLLISFPGKVRELQSIVWEETQITVKTQWDHVVSWSAGLRHEYISWEQPPKDMSPRELAVRSVLGWEVRKMQVMGIKKQKESFVKHQHKGPEKHSTFRFSYLHRKRSQSVSVFRLHAPLVMGAWSSSAVKSEGSAAELCPFLTYAHLAGPWEQQTWLLVCRLWKVTKSGRV